MRPLQALRATPAAGARAIALAFAIVTLAIVAAAIGAVQLTAQNEQAVADAAARDVTDAHFRRAGLVVRFFDRRFGPGRGFGQGGPLLGRRLDREQAALAFAFGLHPVRVPVAGGDLLIAPDMRVFSTLATRVMLVAVLSIAVIAAALTVALRSLNRAAMRPLKETTEALRRLAQRDFTPRMIASSDRSEIGELARAYTAAAETVATALEERRAAEAEMQRFIADAGHELKTPLTTVLAFVDVLERGGLPPETSARLYASMRAESNRMRGLIENLIVLARLDAPEGRSLTLVDVGHVAEAVTEHLAESAQPRRIVLVRDDAAPLVLANEDDLYDAIFNCVENALKYAEGSDVELRVRADQSRVRIEIKDDGPGMAAEDRRRAFERFYRGERTRATSGSGLGLAIVKRVVEKYSGTVSIDDASAGTTISISMPGSGYAWT